MDLRLLLPAVVVWATTVIGLIASRGVILAVGIVGVSVCAAGIFTCMRAIVSWQAIGLVVLAAGLVATCAVGMLLRQEFRDRHPLSAESGKVAVTVVVRDDPVVVGAARTGRVRVRVDVVGVGAREVPTAAAELTGDLRSWATLLPGQRARALVRVRPPPWGSLMVASLTASGPPRLIGVPPGYQRMAGIVRDRLQDNSARALDGASAGLLPGLVLGDIRGLDPVMRADFRAAGLSHLTAVSGANFAIVCGAVLLLVQSLGASPRVAAVLGAMAIVGYVVLVRPSPSVVRAAIMGAVGLLALIAARRAQAFPALGAAVVGGLLWWPELALAPGFALSVAATCGLVLWSPIIRDWLRDCRIPAGLAEVLAMALAAQLVTAPIVAMVTGTFSVVGVVANLVVAPVVAVISIVGTLAALLGVLGPPGGVGAGCAELVLRGLAPELWWMTGCARVLGSPGWASVAVPDGMSGAFLVAVVTAVIVGSVRWVGCVAGVVAGAWRQRRNRRRRGLNRD